MSSARPSVVPDLPARQCADANAGAPARRERPVSLRNRNIGILCDDPGRAEVLALQRVAAGTGARVALVRADLAQASERPASDKMARVLAGLYDVVLCVDLAPATVQGLRDAGAMPVIGVDGGWLREPLANSPESEERGRQLLSQLAALCG